MIEGALSYVIAAYAVTIAGLGGLVVVALLSARRWARLARALDERR
jgi:hypothetical protein